MKLRPDEQRRFRRGSTRSPCQAVTGQVSGFFRRSVVHPFRLCTQVQGSDHIWTPNGHTKSGVVLNLYPAGRLSKNWLLKERVEENCTTSMRSRSIVFLVESTTITFWCAISQS